LIAFLDTSAYARRYLPQAGSEKIRTLMRSRRAVAVSRLAFAETCAAIARAHRERAISLETRDEIIARLPDDFAELDVIEPRRQVIEHVAVLVKTHPLRAYDAMQLASCLHLRSRAATELWCADGDLSAAARAEGLKTVVLA
jgi:predicted nucleic acid-binding protein